MSNKEKYFEYFNSNKGLKRGDLLKGAIAKFGITRLTAENYYSKWEEEKDVEEAVENIFGKDDKPADKPAKGCEESAKDINKKFGQRLKIALLQGKVMSYEIQEGGFLLRQKSYINTIPVDFKDIDDFIAELKELKEVMA